VRARARAPCPSPMRANYVMECAVALRLPLGIDECSSPSI
jgi:hypothetical protein